MRIAFCITELEPGGAERCLVELVTRLGSATVRAGGVLSRPAPGWQSQLAGRHARTLGRQGAFFRRPPRPASSPSVLGRLRRRLAADAPQIVQTFLFHANVLGALAARWAGVPHIVTGIRVAERRGGWHCAAGALDRPLGRAARLREPAQCANSPAKAGCRADKLVVIPNGVDVERFAKARPSPAEGLGVASGRRMIVAIGRLDQQKGLDWLLEQMPRVFDRLPRHDLVLVGEGPERSRLERLAARLAIADRVHFAGISR